MTARRQAPLVALCVAQIAATAAAMFFYLITRPRLHALYPDNLDLPTRLALGRWALPAACVLGSAAVVWGWLRPGGVKKRARAMAAGVSITALSFVAAALLGLAAALR